MKHTRKTDTPRLHTAKDDVLRTDSDLKGAAGRFETIIRSFRTTSFVVFLSPIVGIYVFCLGTAMTPGFLLVRWVFEQTAAWAVLPQSFALASSVGAGLIMFWISMIFVVPTVNFLNPWKVKPQRGGWFSLNVIPWYIHNALVQLVRYTTLDFITPTPLNVLFYRLMGMKIGKGVIINTTNISDPCLITLEDHVTIGGSVTMFAHYGMKGYLIVAPVHIKKGAMIGLKASIMGDVVIGEGATISPHEVVMPKSRVPDNAII